MSNSNEVGELIKKQELFGLVKVTGQSFGHPFEDDEIITILEFDKIIQTMSIEKFITTYDVLPEEAEYVKHGSQQFHDEFENGKSEFSDVDMFQYFYVVSEVGSIAKGGSEFMKNKQNEIVQTKWDMRGLHIWDSSGTEYPEMMKLNMQAAHLMFCTQTEEYVSELLKVPLELAAAFVSAGLQYDDYFSELLNDESVDSLNESDQITLREYLNILISVVMSDDGLGFADVNDLLLQRPVHKLRVVK